MTRCVDQIFMLHRLLELAIYLHERWSWFLLTFVAPSTVLIGNACSNIWWNLKCWMNSLSSWRHCTRKSSARLGCMGSYSSSSHTRWCAPRKSDLASLIQSCRSWLLEFHHECVGIYFCVELLPGDIVSVTEYADDMAILWNSVKTVQWYDIQYAGVYCLPIVLEIER